MFPSGVQIFCDICIYKKLQRFVFFLFEKAFPSPILKNNNFISCSAPWFIDYFSYLLSLLVYLKPFKFKVGLSVYVIYICMYVCMYSHICTLKSSDYLHWPFFLLLLKCWQGWRWEWMRKPQMVICWGHLWESHHVLVGKWFNYFH